MGIDRIYSHRLPDDPRPAFAYDPKTHEFFGYHVTDDPSRLGDFLLQKNDLVSMGYGTDDLGPGLYVSAQPQIWTSRSTGKWSFLKGLAPSDVVQLCGHLRQEEILKEGQGLTASERKAAELTLSRVEKGEYPTDSLVALLANQPYNIGFADPQWLEDRGFSRGKQPVLMEIRWRGTIAMLDGVPTQEDIAPIRRNHVGMAVRNGMGAVAQTVLWNREAITGWTVARETMRDLGLLPEIRSVRTPMIAPLPSPGLRQINR